MRTLILCCLAVAICSPLIEGHLRRRGSFAERFNNFINGRNKRPQQHNNKENEHGSEHGSGHDSGHFHYPGPDGVTSWPQTYPTCAGMRQSPIDFILEDLVEADFASSVRLENYWSRPDWMTVNNNGHALQVNAGFPAGTEPYVTGGPAGDNEYQFAQLHFHWGLQNSEGSEHQVDGFSFPLEVHLVHFNKKYGNAANATDHQDGLLVVGVFFKIGEVNRNLDIILDGVKNLQPESPDSTETTAEINRQPLENIIGEVFNSQYMNYQGSLTTPPCTESVEWMVKLDPVNIALNQELTNLSSPEKVCEVKFNNGVHAMDNNTFVYCHEAVKMVRPY